MTTQTRTVRFAPVAAATIIITAAGLLFAGPLNPPAGPVTSTFKTLTEVEPRIAVNATNTPGDADSLFKITQPGSYYLTGNITGAVGKHGIEIAASGVTLDLNGFDLVGVPAMGAFDGVSVTVGGLTNLAVVNGSVRTWGDAGVDLGTLAAVSSRVEGVRASGNGGYGISAGVGCTVSDCTAYNNTGIGIFAYTGCTVSNCSAYQNTGIGISANTGSTVAHCSVFSNTGHGIGAGAGSTVLNCSAYMNTGIGISADVGCSISNCSAYSNTGHGISAGGGSTVQGCTTRANTLDGIVCSFSCVIRSNTCSSNGSGGDGAGIHATGSDNRIEGNNCIGANRGIDMDAAGNIIIKNTCAGSATNWSIAANNYYGPIINRTGGATAAVNGAAAAGTLTTADPHANFSY